MLTSEAIFEENKYKIELFFPDLIAKVQPMYSKNRYYHDWSHIEEMLSVVPLKESQIIAILFHDCIYEASNTDNELESIAFMRIFIKEEYPFSIQRIRKDLIGRFVDAAARIIKDTIEHIPKAPDAALVLDLDLMRLAVDFDTFSQYGELIRKEYDHLSLDEYNKGRKEFFIKILSRKTLFTTNQFKHLNEQALSNMRKFIQS